MEFLTADVSGHQQKSTRGRMEERKLVEELKSDRRAWPPKLSSVSCGLEGDYPGDPVNQCSFDSGWTLSEELGTMAKECERDSMQGMQGI